MPQVSLSRREFIVAVSTTTAGTIATFGQPSMKTRFDMIGFIKPFQKLSYAEISDIAADIGWHGIECPVRKGGTIEPPAVEDELPKLVAALKENKLELPVIATDVENMSDPLTERVLRTASKLGIRRYRMKHLYYDLSKPIAPQLDSFRPKLRDLAQLNAALGIQGTIQNHSGKNYVGAPVWDMWDLIRNLDPKHLAAYFDIGHATLEGGLSWPLHAKVVEPHLAVVSVKDFLWTRMYRPEAKEREPWKDEWRPLGEGMVQPAFFAWLKKTAFSGPISQHFEYPVGSGKQMIAAMKKDLAVLKEWLA
jgi:sugar phosphate isomerase/epimerase